MKARDWLVFVLLGLTWGSSFFWIKIALEEIGPFLLVALRLLFGAATLALVVLVRRPALPRQWRFWTGVALIGFTNTALPFILISWGEQYIDSGVASILNGTTPLWTLIIAHFFIVEERITAQKLIGLLVGFVGIVVLFVRDLGGSSDAGVWLVVGGQLAVVGASVCYAFSSVYIKRNLQGMTPMMQSFLIAAFADSYAWLLALGFERPLTPPALPITWLALAWLGVLGLGGAYLMYFYLIGSVGPTRATTVTYLVPVIGVALGVAILNEPLDWTLAAGGVLVVAGLWVVNSRRRAARPAERPLPAD